MGDADLRELERRFRETGSLEDRAVCLLARVRGGALDHERLMLAAYLGDDAAHQALGAAPPDFPPTRPVSSFADWVRGLRGYPKEASVRAAIALTRYAASLGGYHPRSVVDVVAESLEAAESWICGVVAQSEVRRELPAAWEERGRFRGVEYPPNVERTLSCLECLFRAVEVSDDHTGNQVVADRRAAYEILPLGHLENHLEVPTGGEAGPLSCLVADLLPWALGDNDPVRDRVEARQREAAGE